MSMNLDGLEYDADSRTLVLTERLGPDEWGASAIVARDCDPATVLALVEAARLGAAWQEAEGALPEGWRGPWLWPDPEEGPYVADAVSGVDSGNFRELGLRRSGPTPVAALLALAEALRGRVT